MEGSPLVKLTPSPWVADYENHILIQALPGTQSFIPNEPGGTMEVEAAAIILGNVELVGDFQIPKGGQIVAAVYREDDVPVLEAARELLDGCRFLLNDARKSRKRNPGGNTKTRFKQLQTLVNRLS